MQVLGIDVGGTGIKGALVDAVTGELVSERHRIATPRPASPGNIAATVAAIVGCCFPAVVVDGEARTAGNIDKSWRRTRVDELFGRATGLKFVVCNDADAAGIAEMQSGAGRGLGGTVIMVTIGTGLGSGVFRDGVLVPNIELGRMPGKDGEPIEFYASNRARKEEDLGWEEWGERFDYFLARVARVMSPDHFIIGGGASKHFGKYRDRITVDVPLHIAKYGNQAGIIGAAMAAADAGP